MFFIAAATDAKNDGGNGEFRLFLQSLLEQSISKFGDMISAVLCFKVAKMYQTVVSQYKYQKLEIIQKCLFHFVG